MISGHHFNRETGRTTIALTIAADTSNYNAFIAAGSPGSAADFVVTVNPGVNVGDSGALGWALRTGALPAGSTFLLINNGTIGGRGGDAWSAGGNAFLLDFDATIDNGAGYIFGGGGGGQTGLPVTYQEYFFQSAQGGGGGGGQGNPGGIGGAPNGNGLNGTPGTDGSMSAAGDGGAGGSGEGSYRGGDGGAGGTWGAPGSYSGLNSAGQRYPTGPGAAGKAVNLIGHTVSFIAGNNSAQVKGAIA